MTSALKYIFGAYLTVRPFFFKMKTIMLISLIPILTVLFLGSAGIVRGNEISVSESASIKTDAEDNSFDFRVTNLEQYLESHNSPLSAHAEDFVKYADENGLDYRLVPAISGVESTFGKRIPYNSYNAYGWANGKYKFTSWTDSISHVSMTLKTKYIDKGAPTIPKIARRYAPPSATWGRNVTFFINKIDTLPVTFDI
jgi:hypothetical protein